ncbi:hypothetical protein D3C72_1374700 [compost metagenome]
MATPCCPHWPPGPRVPRASIPRRRRWLPHIRAHRYGTRPGKPAWPQAKRKWSNDATHCSPSRNTCLPGRTRCRRSRTPATRACGKDVPVLPCGNSSISEMVSCRMNVRGWKPHWRRAACSTPGSRPTAALPTPQGSLSSTRTGAIEPPRPGIRSCPGSNRQRPSSLQWNRR